MAINFRGYLYDDSGTAIQGATVQLLEQDGDQEASTTTDSNGLWYFNEADQDTYDIKITRGSSIRYIQWDDQISLKEIDVRNDSAATTPALTATNLTNNASNQAAIFRSDRGTDNAADGDEAYISFVLRNDNNEEHEFARMTADAVDVSNGSEDGQIRFGVSVGGTMTDVFTINSTTAGSTDMTLDVSGDLTLDADGGDILFKDGGTTFGSATNTSGNLIIKSGTTTALTFSGANVTAAGTIGSGAITSTGIVTGTGFTAGNAVLAEAELELLDGLTAGTAIASKVVTTDANIDTTGQRNLTITGELDAATLDISGSADIAGDLTLSAGGDGALRFSAASSIKILDNSSTALVIEEADNAYITFNTTNSSEAITVAKATTFSSTIAAATGSTIGNLTLANGSITDSGGALDFGNETLTTTGAVDFGAATVDSLSVSDGSITNVDDIALDSISADDTDINIAVSDNSATALTIKQGSDAYLIVDTANSSESVSIGTGISGTAITIGHGTSETTVADNLTVTGNLTVSGTTTTVSSSTLTIGDTLIKLGQAYTGSAYDQGIIFTRGDGSSSNTQNTAMLWDESNDEFVFAATNTEAGTTSGNVTLDDLSNLHVGKITADDTSVFSGSIELGHATDTTIARSGSGDITIEGNAVYRAGGTDVAVADGGTGASSLTDGGILLGSGTSAITAMAVLADSEMIVGDGSTDPVAESGATLRTSIGVGTGDSPQFTDLTLTDDLILNSDSAVISLGAGNDATLTHDGTEGLTIVANPIIVDSGAQIELDSASGILTFEDSGTEVLRFTEGNSGDVTIKLVTNAKDLIFTDNGDAEGFRILDAAAGVKVPGEVMTTKISYTDGDDAITIADGGGITAAAGVTSTAAANAFGASSFAGDVAVADSKFIEFESAAGTPTTDNTVQGIVIEFLAVEAITQFDAVYVSTTTGRVGRADANDAAKMPVIGIAIEAQGSAGSSVRVLTHGVYRDDGGFGGNMTVGVDLYAPETPGTLTTTRPSDDGDFIQVIGVATGVRSAFINPSLDIIEHA